MHRNNPKEFSFSVTPYSLYKWTPKKVVLLELIVLIITIPGSIFSHSIFSNTKVSLFYIVLFTLIVMLIVLWSLGLHLTNLTINDLGIIRMQSMRGGKTRLNIPWYKINFYSIENEILTLNIQPGTILNIFLSQNTIDIPLSIISESNKKFIISNIEANK